MPSDTKTAIVTGAASGIGQVLAQDLYKQGWNVACFDINEDAGQKLIAKLGPRAIFVKCDVANYEDQAKSFTTVFEKWGRIDALLANAGIVDRSSIYIFRNRGSKDIPPAHDLATTHVDYFGVIYGTQLAIHFTRQNLTPGGQIVATASIGAIHPHACFPEYNGTKAAVVQFCRSMAPLLQPKENITINAVLPGLVPTNVVPQAMLDACPQDCLTPTSTVVAAYNVFLADKSRTGQLIECSADKHIFIPEPELLNGHVTKRACAVWEPLFRFMHGEDSGLSDAVPGEDLQPPE